MVAVFGYIRFSFFGLNDTKIARTISDDQERFDILYDPARMEERFYFFEKITLPSLRAQKDQDFRIVVVTSTVMPDRYKARLEQAVADIPQIEILYSDADHVNYALNPWIEENTADLKTKSVHFRLDDDDAICAQMISMLKRDGKRARPDEMLTYPRGLFLASLNGEPYLLRKFEPYIAIAWAFVNAPGQIRNPYQGKHGSHNMMVPSMMDPRPFAYIHVAHESSDTKARKGRKLRKAKEFDPYHSGEKAHARMQSTLRRAFPSFTQEELKDIIVNAPGARLLTQAAAE